MHKKQLEAIRAYLAQGALQVSDKSYDKWQDAFTALQELETELIQGDDEATEIRCPVCLSITNTIVWADGEGTEQYRCYSCGDFMVVDGDVEDEDDEDEDDDDANG